LKSDRGCRTRIIGKNRLGPSSGKRGTLKKKAEWVKDELQRMRSLYAMLSSQVQEIGRKVKVIRNELQENQ
jgi:hypothetical protein